MFTCILSIGFCACKKNHDDNSSSNTPTNPVRLSKVVDLNTNATAPNDTLSIENYTYDNSGRVVLEDVHGFDGTVNYTFTYSYYYNGTDTLPARTVETYDDINGSSTSTTYHTYVSGTRNILVDSSISYEDSPPSNDTFVVHYSYTATSVQVTGESYTSSGHQIYPPSSFDITRQNGNIIYQRESYNTTVNTYNCNYDTHPNPYYNVAWFNNVRIPSIYKYFPDSFGLNNNVTEINITSASTGNPTTVSHYTYSYQYRADGYPTEITVQDQGSTDPGTLTKVIYSYYPTN